MSTLDGPKKRMGRPPVDSEPVKVRLHRAALDRLDAWRGDLSRPDAIRRLVDKGLEAD